MLAVFRPAALHSYLCVPLFSLPHSTAWCCFGWDWSVPIKSRNCIAIIRTTRSRDLMRPWGLCLHEWMSVLTELCFWMNSSESSLEHFNFHLMPWDYTVKTPLIDASAVSLDFPSLMTMPCSSASILLNILFTQSVVIYDSFRKWMNTLGKHEIILGVQWREYIKTLWSKY